jgi:cytosine/adenosine deaminase-related metal-dependent hydrolase
MRTGNLFLRDARLATGEAVDILVEDGVIAAIGAGLSASDPQVPSVEADGALALPGMVDSHLHIDKTLFGMPWMPHWAGPDRESRIAKDIENLDKITLPVEERAGNLVKRLVANGTSHIRTHVDVRTEIGLASVEGVLAVRERYRDRLSIQIVAFPQNGVVRAPGTIELMEAALDAGVDLVGGIDPAGVDGDVEGQLDAVFDLAERKGAGIDLHLHDPAPVGLQEVEAITARTKALGMAGKVNISHAFCADEATFERLAEGMAEAGVSNVTHAPGHREIPPVRKMRAKGVVQGAGNDDVRDTWSPYGTGDMLERAMLIGWCSDFRTEEDLALAFDVASHGGAKVLGLANYGLAVGCRADFFTVAAETLAEAVVSRPLRRLVVKSGRVVARDGAFLET